MAGFDPNLSHTGLDRSTNIEEFLQNAFTSAGDVVVSGGVSPGAFGTGLSGNHIWQGSGAPASASGAIGDYYFRTDGSSSTTHCYFKSASTTWTGIS